VGLWVALLALESTDLGSSEHTGVILLKIWTFFAGSPSDMETFELFHHLLRKAGHFCGYAILSWLIFRALRATWRNAAVAMARSREYFWQLRWALWGIFGTIVAGSLDEFHQSFNPYRTSRWQDVVIDTSGAVVLQIVVFLYFSFSKSVARVRSKA
jgi:VanZ family protein